MNGLHYSKAQRIRVAERDRLSVEIRNGWHLYDMMCVCGSKKDADANLKPKINKMVLERERLASEFNNLVCKIDAGGNSALSMFYADMAEEATAEARKAMQSVIDKWANTKKGSDYF